MSSASSMRDAAALPKRGATMRGKVLLVILLVLIVAFRGLTLLYGHNLHSIDGAMQTWFALDNFARGEQLGTGFQSYLGVTMILGLLPGFWALGGTLFASTLSAHIAVIAGAFATAYAIAWLVRWIRPEQRWIAAILLIFVFYYLGNAAAQVIGLRYPLAFDPGVSLRPVRGALPLLVLPVFVLCIRRAIARKSAMPAFGLGLVAGVGLLWSNDSGIPLMIALTAALGLALTGQRGLMIKSLGLLALGTAVSAGGVLLLATQGNPAPWLQYNFRDVAGDQFWYFAPWDANTRVFSVMDLPKILLGSDLLSGVSLVLLGLSVVAVFVRRVRGRGSPVRDAAFVMVGASTLGTALIPQVGGHIDGVYNNITFMFGLCAPVLVFQRQVLRVIRPLWRRLPKLAPLATMAVAATIMLAVEAARFAMVVNATDRDVYDPALGFHVEEDMAVDLAAMRWLADDWDKQNVAQDRRLLSVYTSVLDVAADTRSPAPVGSLIHALGTENRAAYTALVANSQVAAVTTIHPDYSGWEGWMRRANWPFFRALYANYRPLAANDQHVLWVRADTPAKPIGNARCRVAEVSQNALRLTIDASDAGLVAVSVKRSGPFASGRSAMLTVTETSPDTQSAQAPKWTDFPRYGVANAATLELVAPVEPGQSSELLLEVMDGSAIGTAHCSARVYRTINYTALPSLPDGIASHLAGSPR